MLNNHNIQSQITSFIYIKRSSDYFVLRTICREAHLPHLTLLVLSSHPGARLSDVNSYFHTGFGRRRFMFVSMRNTVYSCIIHYYIIYVHYNCKPTFANHLYIPVQQWLLLVCWKWELKIKGLNYALISILLLSHGPAKLKNEYQERVTRWGLSLTHFGCLAYVWIYAGTCSTIVLHILVYTYL